jgi:hypothetical protein
MRPISERRGPRFLRAFDFGLRGDGLLAPPGALRSDAATRTSGEASNVGSRRPPECPRPCAITRPNTYARGHTRRRSPPTSYGGGFKASLSGGRRAGKVAARIASFDEYSGHANGPELASWIAGRRPIQRGVFLVHGEEPAISGLAERIVPAAIVFNPILDDIYELTTAAPTPLDGKQRRRLQPEAVVALDWHNVMSELVLDINERIEAAADDRARGVIIRRLRRALDAKD